MAKVSVIIPSYNHASYLREAIDCVLAQTFSDWELVIVDDASSDESFAVAREYGDPRIHVYRNESNLGAYATENRCLDLSGGEYVAALNSDDVWGHAKLERQVAALDSHQECSFSYTRGTATDQMLVPKEDPHHRDLPAEPVQQPIASLLFENRILASSVVFRRGLIRFDPKANTAGDWIALLRLCKRGKAAFIDEPLSFWRHHPGNTSGKFADCLPEEVRLRWAILADFDQWMLPGADPEEVRKGLALCGIRLQTLLVYGGDSGAAKQALKLALKADPNNSQAKHRLLGHYLPRSIMLRRFGPPVPVQEFEEAYRNMHHDPVDLS